VFAEDANRALTFYADESPEQTRRVIQALATDAATGTDARELIIPTHHAMQRMLRGYRVVIPYAPVLAATFPTRRVEARRALPHLLSAIKAVALLRQFQKQPRDGSIEADADDYAAALEIVQPSIERLTGQTDAHVQRVRKAIEEHHGQREFGRSDVALWAGIRESDAGGRLRVLAEQGYVVEVQEHRGNKPAKFKVNDAPPEEEPDTPSDLPHVEAIRHSLQRGGSR
jgi:hypothetical protein